MVLPATLDKLRTVSRNRLDSCKREVVSDSLRD
jgi:hypothetical protein